MDINSTHKSYLQLNQEKIKELDLQIYVLEKKIAVAAYILSGKYIGKKLLIASIGFRY